MPAPRATPFAFPKALRLRLDRDFQAVRTRGGGRRVLGTECAVRWARNALGHARLGLATPRRYGSAVRRNRFRRVARAAFRSVAGRLESLDLLVEPRLDAKQPTLAGITADLLSVVAAARARLAGPRP